MKSFPIFLVLLSLGVLVTARFSYIVGECPGGYLPGAEWYDQTPCRRCRCVETGYVCYDCEDDVPFVLMDNCYMVKKKANNSAKYPDCCSRQTAICKGDNRFDQYVFEAFVDKQRP